MVINSVWAIDKLLSANEDELADMLYLMDENSFKIWYKGCLALYKACQHHIDEEGLEHLRDEYEG